MIPPANSSRSGGKTHRRTIQGCAGKTKCPWSDPRTATRNQRDQEEHEKDNEQDLGDFRRACGDAADVPPTVINSPLAKIMYASCSPDAVRAMSGTSRAETTGGAPVSATRARRFAVLNPRRVVKLVPNEVPGVEDIV